MEKKKEKIIRQVISRTPAIGDDGKKMKGFVVEKVIYKKVPSRLKNN